jgi:amino acid adenylation domain-containing protein
LNDHSAVATEAFAFPLSFAQQRLWFLDQLEPGSSVYSIPAALRLTGQLDIMMLKQSFNEVVRRHETLRTTFAVMDEEVVQVIAATSSVTLLVVDLGGLSQAKREAVTQHLAMEEAERSFNLSTGPLLRVLLLHLDEQDHVLFLTMHHIISDFWSMGILSQEVISLYEAICNGTPPLLPELSIQYADFAVWQRRWLQGEVLEAHRAYWRQQLDDVRVLNLPADRLRPLVQTYRNAIEPMVLTRDLAEALKSLSRQEGTTLFVTLLAVFELLLHRYTGQTDIVVGSPFTNRNRAETKGLIGFFVNMLVLRTDLFGNPTFRELLARVKKVAQEAYAHQDLPFEMLVKELEPERDLSRSPLFQVMFVLQNTPRGMLELPGLTLSPLKAGGGTPGAAQFDLTLSIEIAERGLLGAFEYNVDLFDAATIERIIGHFRILLEGVTADPDRRICDLPLLTEAERRQVVVEWNDTHLEYPQDECVHELFEAQVEQTPDAVAVAFDGQQITYEELDRRANQLAHYLQGMGVEPEVLVGIYLERSLEMVIGLLGVLKVGGAYVPLDPAYPKERLAFMLEDARVSVLLTQRCLLDGFPEHQARVVYLDTEWEEIAGMPQNAPLAAVTADNVAYTIYTSGSTGKPKGVQILHSAVVNFLESMRKKPGLVKWDIMLSVTTLSFDIAALELCLPLVVGARVDLVSRVVAADGLQLMERLVTSQATVMQATPATWQLLLEAGWQGKMGLKALCGGEALPRLLADKLLDSGATLWNMYGPTETTIWSAICKVEREGDAVPLGRPIANTQIYLLDPYLRPVPVGVPGELYIGGDGLARGYLGRAALTAERFIPNPLISSISSEGDRGARKTGAGARLYRTGDLARYSPDGSIAFLGRADNQVKVRGFRIELGEIEVALMRHEAVQRAVVVAQGDTPNDKRLVAYVVANDGQVPLTDEWRRFLQGRLPEYMVPSVFVTLEALPLTPNGKVDRRALPEPDGLRPELEIVYVAPRSEVERAIAAVWKDVLQIDRVGVHDNFFDLGGHSLLLTRAYVRLMKVSSGNLSMIDLFRYPTISSLARHLLSPEGNEQSSVQQTNDRVERLQEGQDRLKQLFQRTASVKAD